MAEPYTDAELDFLSGRLRSRPNVRLLATVDALRKELNRQRDGYDYLEELLRNAEAERDRLRQALKEIDRASEYAHPPERATGYVKTLARNALLELPK